MPLSKKSRLKAAWILREDFDQTSSSLSLHFYNASKREKQLKHLIFETYESSPRDSDTDFKSLKAKDMKNK